MNSPRSCPGCGFSAPTEFFEARGAPVDVGVQWESRAAARSCPRGNVRLAFCRQCGLIFNAAFEPQLLGSAQSYENPLDCSPTFQAYARSLAQQLIERYGIRDKTVVEIGCGNGSFLRLLCALGNNHGVGFDPCHAAGQGDTKGTDPTVEIVAAEYSPRHADQHADLLCCRHLLDHIGAPRAFLCGLREILNGLPAAVAYFEVPECGSIFLQPYPWLIIYEHCLYFTKASLSRLFTECGYAVQRAGRAYGDTFAFVEARLAERSADRPSAGKPDLGGLAAAIETFPARHAGVLESWHARLRDRLNNGARLALWGAGARSVGFTSAVGAADQIPFVVDLNPRKWGHYLSGTGQEIVPPEFLREYRPSAVIVMNALYRNEIERSVRDLGLTPEFLCL
jgi:SAM-dependent methyltransferase